jgi:dCTP deaminase
MAILTGPEIARQVELGNIHIDDFDPERVGANSYDLRLGHSLRVYEEMVEFIGGVPYLKSVFRQMGLPAWVEQPPLRRSNRSEEEFPFPCLDMKRDNPTIEVKIPATGLVLMPGVVFLGSTIEVTRTQLFAPNLDGRSSVGRLGMQVHLTAGFGDDGFEGDWTLEITAVHPVRVYAGVRVAQIWFSTLEGERKPYRGKYQGQRGPKASNLWKDFESDGEGKSERRRESRQ